MLILWEVEEEAGQEEKSVLILWEEEEEAEDEKSVLILWEEEEKMEEEKKSVPVGSTWVRKAEGA